MTPAKPVELKDKEKPAAPPADTRQGRTPVQPRAPKSAKQTARVLLFTKDGSIEWEKMSPEARKSFEELFKNPQFLKAFGLSGAQAGTFKPEQCKALFDSVAVILKGICRVFLRFPALALPYLDYSDRQKEMLGEPTAEVLNKLAPKILKENSELVIFGTVFFSATQENFVKARAVAIAELKRQAAEREGKKNASPLATVPVNGQGDQPEIIEPFKSPPSGGGVSFGIGD